MALLRLLLYAGTAPIVAAWNTDQFQSWYPQFAPNLTAIVGSNCSGLYQGYLAHNQTAIEDDGYALSALTAPLTSCILDHCTEAEKANMAAAGVVLGLTPTILAFLGSTTDETAALSVIARRPFLTLCLALGTPAFAPMRAFNAPDVVAMLHTARPGSLDHMHFHEFSGRARITITALQYALALAAIFNVATTSYQLGLSTVNSFATETTYLPLLWVSVAGLVHFGGTLSLHLRVRVRVHDPLPLPDVAHISRPVSLWQRCRRRLVTEFSPAGAHEPLRVQPRRKAGSTYAFLFISWLTACGTAIDILFGTIVLSSCLFISVRDALFVILRYAASVICCQLIVAYELAGLRHIYSSRQSLVPKSP